MAPGSTITYTTAIEFVPGSGVYVDISARVGSVTITRPRPSRFGEASPTTLELELQNDPATTADVAAWGTTVGAGFCPFSTDSPVAAFSPNVERDRMVKITATWAGGASTAVRFWGWIDKWLPDAGDRPPATATVTVSASCILSRYARRTILSQYGEYNQQSPDYDYWPLNEAPDSVTLKGYAQPGQAVNDATVVLPTSAPGKAELQSPEGGHSTDGQIEFSRGDNTNYPSPVILVPLRKDGSVLASFEAWMKLTVDPGGLNDDVINGYTADGQKLWGWNASVVAGNIVWQLFDSSGTVKTSYATNAPRDDGWHFWFLRFNAGNTVDAFYSNRGNMYASSAGGSAFSYDPRKVDYIIVGGRMSPTRKGKQTNTFQGAMSSFRAGYNGNGASGQGVNDPGTSITTATHKAILVSAGLGIDTTVGGAVSTVGDTRRIQPTIRYNNLLERWNEMTRSNLAVLRTRPDGRREWNSLADTRPQAVAVTLDAEQDLSAPDGGWVRVKDEVPTRTNVTAPPGQITYTRTAVETALGQRLDGPDIDTANGDTTGMRAVAAWATFPVGGRMQSFGVDLTTTSTDKLTALMAVQPAYSRLRITNLPTALQGLTYLDVFASGWVETFIAESGACAFAFDTDPADDPSTGVYDDAEYGRWAAGSGAATATGGTAVGTAAVGTLVVTSTAPLTVKPASYPLDLSWGGERVTVTAAPSSSTSPQTLTLTARGVAPTVARIHAAGDPVEIWHAKRFGV